MPKKRWRLMESINRGVLTSIIPEHQDTNFDWQIFFNKVNSELVNKIANLFNRVSTQIKKHFDGKLEPALFKNIPDLSEAHAEAIQALETYELNGALSRIVLLSEEANKYLDDVKPWNVIKEDKEKAKLLFAHAAHYMVSVAALLQPFLPSYSDRVLKGFSIPADSELRGVLYRESGAAMLKGRGLNIQAESDFVIPRIEIKKIEEEISKLESLSAKK